MGRGRPTDYEPDYHNDRAFKLALLGADDALICDIFDIAESTLNLWKLKHPEFSESINKGKIEADSEMAFSLYRKGKGYKYKEKTYETEITEDPETKEKTRRLRITKIVEKEQSPDTGAAFIWLKNRQSKLWRDKIQIDSRTEIANLNDYEQLAEQARQLAKRLNLDNGSN